MKPRIEKNVIQGQFPPGKTPKNFHFPAQKRVGRNNLNKETLQSPTLQWKFWKILISPQNFREK